MSLKCYFIHYMPLKLSKSCECDFWKKVFGIHEIKTRTLFFFFVLFIYIAHQEATKRTIVGSGCSEFQFQLIMKVSSEKKEFSILVVEKL